MSLAASQLTAYYSNGPNIDAIPRIVALSWIMRVTGLDLRLTVRRAGRPRIRTE